MKINKTFIRNESESLNDIEAYLEGKVFHVTRLAYLPLIIQSGEIRSNKDKALRTTFGVYNAFFNNRDCVSLFDYRQKPNNKVTDFRGRCDPLKPAYPPNGPIAILILKPSVYDDLIPWTLRNKEKAFSEQIVPYVEVGYPGAIPLSHVEEIISVEITEDPKSFAAQLRKIFEANG